MSLDLEGHRRNLRYILKFPLTAIVAPAGTGELYSLSPEEHLAVVKATLDEVDGKIPVLTGVGFNYPIAIAAGEERREGRRGWHPRAAAVFPRRR